LKLSGVPGSGRDRDSPIVIPLGSSPSCIVRRFDPIPWTGTDASVGTRFIQTGHFCGKRLPNRAESCPKTMERGSEEERKLPHLLPRALEYCSMRSRDSKSSRSRKIHGEGNGRCDSISEISIFETTVRGSRRHTDGKHDRKDTITALKHKNVLTNRYRFRLTLDIVRHNKRMQGEYR